MPLSPYEKEALCLPNASHTLDDEAGSGTGKPTLF